MNIALIPAKNVLYNETVFTPAGQPGRVIEIDCSVGMDDPLITVEVARGSGYSIVPERHWMSTLHVLADSLSVQYHQDHLAELALDAEDA